MGWTDSQERYHVAYREGFNDGVEWAQRATSIAKAAPIAASKARQSKRVRKLSAWQKFVKVNSKKPRFRFKSGSKKGKINLKALGVAYRKTPAGKKKR